MSWDVVMVRTKTNGEALKDIAGENIVPFTQGGAGSFERWKKYRDGILDNG